MNGVDISTKKGSAVFRANVGSRYVSKKGFGWVVLTISHPDLEEVFNIYRSLIKKKKGFLGVSLSFERRIGHILSFHMAVEGKLPEQIVL